MSDASRTPPPRAVRGNLLRMRVVAALVLLLGLAAVLATTLFVVQAAQTPPPERERKFRDAARELLYRVRAESSPRLVLSRGERVVYLVTHAVLPRDVPTDRAVPYGLRVRVRQPDGRLLFAQEIWSRSRRSRARFEGGVWLDENAFTADGTVLGDDRVLEVGLPAGVAQGAMMDFAPVGGASEVLLRVYRRARLADVTSDVRRFALSPRERQRLAATQGAPRWEALPERERDTYVATEWQRLAAYGEDGIDYETRPIFYSGFRRREARVEETPGVRVDPLHAAAWNVLGPALLVLRSEGAAIEASTLDETGRALVIGRGRAEPGPTYTTRLALGEGAHTIAVRAPEGEARVSLVSETLDARVHLREGPHPPPVDGALRLDPDLRHVPLYEASVERGHDALCFAVDGDGDLEARALRVEVRTALCAPPHTPAPTEVRYAFSSDRGADTFEGTVSVEATRSEFETVRLGDGASCLVTEPVALRFLAPVGASRFCVAGTQTALFRVSTLLGDTHELAPPYRDHAGPLAAWRYAPPTLRRWVALRAHRHGALATARRVPSLTAQCRLEARGADVAADPAASAPLALTEIEPHGRARRERILDPLGDGAVRDSAGIYTALGPEPVRVRVPPGAVETRLWFWTRAPGAPLRVLADDQTLFEAALRTQSGVLSLRGLEAGVRTFSAEHVVPDLGVLKAYPEVVFEGRRLRFLNGMSANERTGCVGNWRRMGLDAIDPDAAVDEVVVTVVNNRDDRVARSEVFGRILVEDLGADRHVLIGTNLGGLVGYVDAALARLLPTLEVLDADDAADTGATRAVERLARTLARLRVPRPSVEQALARLAAYARGAQLGLTAPAALAPALAAWLAPSTDQSARVTDVVAELGRDAALRAALDAALVPTDAPWDAAHPETLAPASREDVVTHFRGAFARMVVHARLRARLPAGRTRADVDAFHAVLRDAYRALLHDALVVVSDGKATGDQIVTRVARAIPPGTRASVMGIQNIKGTGLDFAYRWVALEHVAGALADLRRESPTRRARAFAALESFQDYGVLDAGLACARLRRLEPELGAQSERDRANALRARLEAIHAERRAALSPAGHVGRSALSAARRAFAHAVDHVDSVRRTRESRQILEDLVAERISIARAALELRALTARQKHG